MGLISKTLEIEENSFLLGTEKINKRQELNNYIKQGLIKIEFRPIESLKLRLGNLHKLLPKLMGAVRLK